MPWVHPERVRLWIVLPLPVIDTVDLINDLYTTWHYRKILLFANSRSACDRLFSIVNTTGRFQGAAELHYSNLKPLERKGAEKRFRKRERAMCIATSTLELGIDVGDVEVISCLYEKKRISLAAMQSLFPAPGASGDPSGATSTTSIIDPTDPTGSVGSIDPIGFIGPPVPPGPPGSMEPHRRGSTGQCRRRAPFLWVSDSIQLDYCRA